MTAHHPWTDSPPDAEWTVEKTATHNARSLRAWMADSTLLTPPELIIPALAWRGRTTLLAGVEKGGKSTLLSQAASIVSTGGLFLNQQVSAGKVLWCGLEEHPGDIVRRFAELGADKDNMIVASELAGIGDLQALIREHAPTLVCIDTLIAYTRDTITDAFSSSQWAPVVQELSNLAHGTNTSVVMLHHARKSDGRSRDSSAITAGVDTICEMLMPSETDSARDNTRRVLDVRGRVCRRTKVEIHLDETARYVLAGPSGLSIDVEVLQAVQRTPGMPSDTVTREVGRKKKAVAEALTELERSGLIEDRGPPAGGRGHRWYATAR